MDNTKDIAKAYEMGLNADPTWLERSEMRAEIAGLKAQVAQLEAFWRDAEARAEAYRAKWLGEG